MFCKCFSAAITGIKVHLVTVEVDIRNGLPMFQMVGGVAGEVKEAKDRVKIALENSGFILPPKHITVNMSPAEIKKEGTSFDLPVAAALLAAFGYLPDKNLDKCMILGELSLDGKVNKTGNLMPFIFTARENGLGIICPKEDLSEIGWSDDVPMCGISTVEELAEVLSDDEFENRFSPVSDYVPKFRCEKDPFPFRGIYGDPRSKRAVLIAASGGHNVFMAGKAENEKKKLANAFVKLLPPLTHDEMIGLLEVRSFTGEKKPDIVDRRCVENDTSQIFDEKALFNAHLGLLYCENVNSAKAQNVTVVRQEIKKRSFSFNLIASGTLCPCGNYPDKEKCSCTMKQITKHLSSLDPFFKDETDIRITVSEPDFRSLKSGGGDENNHEEKLLCARKRQSLRFSCPNRLNADMTDSETERICVLSDSCREFLDTLLPEDYGISSYFKLLRVARTVADTEDSDDICLKHLEEAYFLVGER